jgi:hypothetical protein
MAKVAALTSSRLPAPQVNDLVRVTVGLGDDEAADDVPLLASEVASRVEDVSVDPRTGGPLAYLIAAPWFAGDLEQPPPGTACALQWPTDRGLCTLPVQLLTEEAGPTGLRLWRVRVTGPVRRHERRRYVRAPWALPTQIHVRQDIEALPSERRHLVERAGIKQRLGELPETYGATCVNVSEGGLLCVSPAPVMPALLPLVVRFTIEDTCFETSASIVWSLLREGTVPGTGAGEGAVVESAIAFDEPGRLGELLRPLVFQAQLRARRQGLL